MKLAVLKEITGNGEVDQPTLKEILEYQGDRLSPSPEAMPHEKAFIHANAVEGSQKLESLKQPSEKHMRWCKLHRRDH